MRGARASAGNVGVASRASVKRRLPRRTPKSVCVHSAAAAGGAVAVFGVRRLQAPLSLAARVGSTTAVVGSRCRTLSAGTVGVASRASVKRHLRPPHSKKSRVHSAFSGWLGGSGSLECGDFRRRFRWPHESARRQRLLARGCHVAERAVTVGVASRASVKRRLQAAALQKVSRPFSVRGWRGGTGFWSAATSGAAFAGRTESARPTAVVGSRRPPRYVPEPLASLRGRP
jgi:hypothetical protein